MKKNYLIVPEWAIRQNRHPLPGKEIYDIVEMDSVWSFKYRRSDMRTYNGGMGGIFIKLQFPKGAMIECTLKTFSSKPKVVRRCLLTIKEVAQIFSDSKTVVQSEKYVKYFPLCYINDIEVRKKQEAKLKNFAKAA